MRATIVLVILWKWGQCLPTSQTEHGELKRFLSEGNQRDKSVILLESPDPDLQNEIKESALFKEELLPRAPEGPAQARVERSAPHPKPVSMRTVTYVKRMPCARGDCSDPNVYEFVLIKPNGNLDRNKR